MDQTAAIVIGAGHAGLATSHALAAARVDHLVLEQGRIGDSWRGRWDSFRLVLPNWSMRLPGYAYDGPEPDGFMRRDEIVAFLEGYAESFGAPVREGVRAESISKNDDGSFTVTTTAGDVRAGAVVVATGAFQRAHRPSGAAELPDALAMDLTAYRNPEALPPGGVLVVGSGQSGCQIAEELHRSGRRVVVACGRAPWAPRRIAGRDFLWWALEAGVLEQPVDALPSPDARLVANPQASGQDGGHDLHYRVLRDLGVTLAGHFRGVDGGRVAFDDDLAESVAFGDARYGEMMEAFRAVAERHGIDFPDPTVEPFAERGPTEIDLSEFGTVIFTSGFRPDYTSWLPWPEAFDSHGFPLQRDGASTVVDGLYFVGVHFLRKRKSALFLGAGEDAEIVARAIASG